MADLKAYHAKRRFGDTPEPRGKVPREAADPRPVFVVQKHEATRLHWDFRLEWRGVLLSWAVTHGPSDDPSQKRLAVRTEDHPLEYSDFEGSIPPGNYGAGEVMLWDRGTWAPLPGEDFEGGLIEGKLKFVLDGVRMKGGWTLVRMKPRSAADAKRENWLLIKERDEYATDQSDRLTETYVTSVNDTGSAKAMPLRVKGARKSRPATQDLIRPGFVAPQLATLARHLPEGAGWWHEAKLDGYRGQIALGNGGPVIFSRSGEDWSDRFAPLMEPAAMLLCRSALIDGEVIVPSGGFSDLQRALKNGSPLVFVAFDLLYLDGHDLRHLALSERRTRLEALMDGAPPQLRLSPRVETDAASVLAKLCAAGGEGVVCKRSDAPYRSGRGASWLKVKCRSDAEFIIVGSEASSSPMRPFASILLATNEKGRLVYRGKVGTGFGAVVMKDLAARMDAIATEQSPLAEKAAGARKVRWVRPELVAQIKFAEFTADGHIRHGSFQALREDKMPDDVAAEGVESKVILRGQAISSPDRVVFSDVGLIKADVARYYDAVADRMLPFLRNRPLSLVRHPDGVDKPGFFQKHAGPGFPSTIREAEVLGDTVMLINRADGILAAVQMGAIEFHIRGTRADSPEKPDRMVFDLDPDPAVGFAEVREAAAEIRDRLATLGLPSWPMVTGGKGVHVVVPLARVASTETVGLFAKLFATRLAQQVPDRFTSMLAKKKRVGRIFVDWLRNQQQATAVCPWSLRARPGAPVAVPVEWDELAALERADAFGVEAAIGHSPITEPRPVAITAAVIRKFESAG